MNTLPAVRKPKVQRPLSDMAKAAAKVYVRDGKYSARATARLMDMSPSHLKRLLKRRDFQALVEREQRDLGIATRAIRYDVVRETHRVAKANIVDVLEVLNPDGNGINLENMKNLPPELRAAVKTIEVDEEFVTSKILKRKIRVGMHDKVRALMALSEMVNVKHDRPEDNTEDAELKLLGIIIEGPDGQKQTLMNDPPTKRDESAIDADFEIVDEEEDEWLKI